MRRCEVCDTETTGREADCEVCETPLSGPLPVSVEAAPARRWPAGLPTLVFVLCVALGFGAGLLSDRFLPSSVPGPLAVSEETFDAPVELGQCLELAGYELLNREIANIASHVVDCSEASALVSVTDPDACTARCHTAEVAGGQFISFHEIPAVGRCFFAYLSGDRRGRGWPSSFVPCSAVPDRRVVDSAPRIANELKVDVNTLRLVTHIVTSVSLEVPTCADGQDVWHLEYRDPDQWLCVTDVRTP